MDVHFLFSYLLYLLRRRRRRRRRLLLLLLPQNVLSIHLSLPLSARPIAAHREKREPGQKMFPLQRFRFFFFFFFFFFQHSLSLSLCGC